MNEEEYIENFEKRRLWCESQFKQAVEIAVKNKEILPEALQFSTKEIQLTTRICFEIAKLYEGKPFWLTGESIAKALSIDGDEGRRFIRLLITSDIIQVVNKNGNYRQFIYTGESKKEIIIAEENEFRMWTYRKYVEEYEKILAENEELKRDLEQKNK